MKFHKTLCWFSAINFGGCLLFFYILYRNLSDPNDRGLNVALGWIGWLAMLTFIVPASVSADTRAEWFSKQYGVGTLLLLLIDVMATIAGSVIANTLAK